MKHTCNNIIWSDIKYHAQTVFNHMFCNQRNVGCNATSVDKLRVLKQEPLACDSFQAPHSHNTCNPCSLGRHAVCTGHKAAPRVASFPYLWAVLLSVPTCVITSHPPALSLNYINCPLNLFPSLISPSPFIQHRPGVRGWHKYVLISYFVHYTFYSVLSELFANFHLERFINCVLLACVKFWSNKCFLYFLVLCVGYLLK